MQGDLILGLSSNLQRSVIT